MVPSYLVSNSILRFHPNMRSTRSTSAFASLQCPADILLEIFILLKCEKLPRMRAKEFPMVFTHICHRWREVATSSPLLWNRLEVRIPEDIGRNPSARMQAFFFYQCWLERSGSALLKVSLSSPPRLYNSRQEDVSDVFCGLYLEALLRHSAHLSDLTIHIRHTPSPFRHGSSLTSSGALRNLTIGTDFIWNSADIIPFLSAAASQDISSVALELPRFSPTQDRATRLSSTILPWSYLTDLTIDEEGLSNTFYPSLSCSPVLDVLEQCRNLVNLHIHLRKSLYTLDHMSRPLINLPRLRILSLSWPNSTWRDTLLALLGNIFCPVLITFSALSGQSHDHHFNNAVIVRFITRHSATLQALAIHGTRDYEPIFRAAPNITYLALANITRTEWITPLVASETIPLQELVLLNTHQRPLALAQGVPLSFFDFIRHRCQGRTPGGNLRILRLYPCFWKAVLDVPGDHHEGHTVNSLLKECKEHGLQLYVEGIQYEHSEHANCCEWNCRKWS